MSKKKLKDDGIFFVGKSSEDVTGSQFLVKFGETQCLLECGMHQSSSNDYLDSYKINSEKFKFKPEEIDIVFLNHVHIDHCGLLPRLVKEGFRGQIIATSKTAKILKPLLFNSCAIIQDEARVLSKRYKREYKPLYSDDDVFKTLSLVKTYDEYNKIFKLNDNISFQWFKNSHCIGAAQLQLILRNGTKVRRILYTSDLGALHSSNHYLPDTEIPESFADISLMESTYGLASRSVKKKRVFDIEHIKSAVSTVVERRGTVIFPCFSFSRTQEILTTLYEIFGGNDSFRIPVYVDSKLSCDISELYDELLDGADLDKWKAVCGWKNLRFIKEKPESDSCVADGAPKIVISSSGFCTNGRVVEYLKRYLRDRNSMIIFSGYAGDNPSYLSYRIKNYRNHKFIKINKEMVPNRADSITLSTFSSHANFDDLVKFGSSLNTNKVVLVHGSTEAKKCLAEKLEDAISNNNKTYRVISAHRGMIVRL